MKNKLIIVFLFLAQLAYSQSTAKQGFQKIGLTGTMSNYNSVLESEDKFSTGSLTLGSNTAVLTNTKLKVTGNIELDNSTGVTGNIYKGGQLWLHNYGNFNSFIGFQSGNFTGTGGSNYSFGSLNFRNLTSGTFNVAIGSGTLELNTTGDFNVGIGQNALKFNTSGFQNIAIGRIALGSNTTGGQNIAIGDQALFNQISRSDNVAIGASSLYANISGNFLTALGYSALQYSTGSNNTAIGYNSGIYTTGSRVTALGTNSNVANIGSDNISIGFESNLLLNNVSAGSFIIGRTYKINIVGTTDFTLIGSPSNTVLQNFVATGAGTGTGSALELSTGSSNIALGNYTQKSLISGSSNISIGTNSGNNVLQIINPTNSIAIGANTFTTQSNQVVLGDASITQTLLSGVIKKRALDTAPATATSAGTLGEIRVTATAIFVCIATNTWVRTLLTTF
jgi:hypothetical protein